jgi:UDP-N-acetylglucosamine--N-acetylmuramyl-(pentapeptide) pyrophosphoryl-undecaprenol N-acetylglucosamine transferase
MTQPFHIVFSGGGTGGHLFPGLAVAEQLLASAPQTRITFAGTGKPFEQCRVIGAGYDYLAVPSRPLSLSPGKLFSFAVENLAGHLAAARFLEEESVSLAVGLGGYASVPMGRAAARRGVPLVLLEQNAIPGKATRWLARRAALVCAALAQTRANLRCRCPVRVSGTPIRPGIHASARDQAARPRRQLLILGGSNGAQSLNENVPLALYRIREELAGWRIVHQAGKRGYGATCELYRKLGSDAEIIDFIVDMPETLAASDLVVCRAGGTTLAELSAANLPAVLLPYPLAADNHQRANAEAFASAGAAVMLDEREASGRVDVRLAEVVSGLLKDPSRQAQMSAAMRRLARPHAAADVAAMVLETAGTGSLPAAICPAA